MPGFLVLRSLPTQPPRPPCRRRAVRGARLHAGWGGQRASSPGAPAREGQTAQTGARRRRSNFADGGPRARGTVERWGEEGEGDGEGEKKKKRKEKEWKTTSLARGPACACRTSRTCPRGPQRVWSGREEDAVIELLGRRRCGLPRILSQSGSCQRAPHDATTPADRPRPSCLAPRSRAVGA